MTPPSRYLHRLYCPNMNPQNQLTQAAVDVMTKAALHDRVLGCLFGAALGDAIGLYTEFLTPEAAWEAYPTGKFTLLPSSETTRLLDDDHRSPHNPGHWTDDTDHALLILLSYLHADGESLDPKELAQRLRVWVNEGLIALDTPALGLGRTVGGIVKNVGYLDDPEGTARKYWASSGYQVAPNGSLMRTHPLGLMCLSKSPEETFQVAASYSNVTHVDPRCVISCAIGTALVRGLVLGEVSQEAHIDAMIDRALAWWITYHKRHMEGETRRGEPDLEVEELMRYAKANDLAELELASERAIGYVYKCFGSGIFLLRLAMRAPKTMDAQMNLFESLITDLVMRGGDADTNACFAGSLLGSYLGFRSLPPHWRDGLKHGGWLLEKSEELCTVLGIGNGIPNQKLDTSRDGGRGS